MLREGGTPRERELLRLSRGHPPDIAASFRRIEEAEDRRERRLAGGSDEPGGEEPTPAAEDAALTVARCLMASSCVEHGAHMLCEAAAESKPPLRLTRAVADRAAAIVAGHGGYGVHVHEMTKLARRLLDAADEHRTRCRHAARPWWTTGEDENAGTD